MKIKLMKMEIKLKERLL